MKGVVRALVSLAALAVGAGAMAEDFDGSTPLLCAPVEVIDCVPDVPCFSGTPGRLGAPSFLRIDFARNTVAGPHAETRIAALQKSETQLLLQGVEAGRAFSIALDRQDGRMTATLSDTRGAFVLFGSCTPQ